MQPVFGVSADHRHGESLPPNVCERYRKLVGKTFDKNEQLNSVSRFNPLNHQDAHFVSCFLEDTGSSDLTEKVLDASQSIIRAQIKKGSKGKRITSRLGGVPDVEEGWQWPERLEFLAQLNLEELAPYDINGVLPQNGLLRFFMLNLAHEWEDDGFRVEFYNGDLAGLQRAQAPEFLTDLRDGDSSEFEDVIYKEAELEFESGTQINVYEADFSDREMLYEAGNIASFIADALETERDRKWDHQVLGTVSRYAFIPKPREEKDWVLLFAIGSAEDETGMMFSDAGVMYFYMRRDDLQARRFDRVHVTMTNG